MTDNYVKPLDSDYVRFGAAAIRKNAEESYQREEQAKTKAEDAQGRATVAAAAALGTVDARSFAGGLVGANFRPTWIEVARDGGMTERVKTLIKEAVGFTQVDAAFNSLGLIGANYRGTALTAAGAGSTPQQAQPTFSDPKTWTHYGDSLTQGGSPEALATLTGYTHLNGGISGNTSYQAAVRAGAILYQVKIQGGAIPASGGSVAITEHYPSPMPMAHTWEYPGDLAGVPGYIKRDDNGSFRFHSQGQAPKPVGGWQTFTPGLYAKGREGTAAGHSLIIGLGRNDLNLGLPLDQLITNIGRIIQASAAKIPNVLVWEIPPWRTEPTGSKAREKLDAWNTALEQAFPQNFVRPSSFLRTREAFSAVGASPTSQDAEEMGRGLTPASFRRDADGHFNDLGNKAWAIFMKTEMEKRGWLYA